MKESFSEGVRALLAQGLDPSELHVVLHPDDETAEIREAAEALSMKVGYSKWVNRGQVIVVRKLLGKPPRKPSA